MKRIIAGEGTLLQSGGFPHFESGESPNFVQQLLNCVRQRFAAAKKHPQAGQAEEQKRLRARFRDGDQGQRDAAAGSCSVSIAVVSGVFSPALVFVASERRTLIAVEIDQFY
jgi:hypothetical protein